MIIKLKGQYRFGDYLDTEDIRFLQNTVGGKWHIHTHDGNGKHSTDATICRVYGNYYEDMPRNKSIDELPVDAEICKTCAKIVAKYVDIIKKCEKAASEESQKQIYNSVKIAPEKNVNINFGMTSPDGDVSIQGTIPAKMANRIIEMISKEILNIPKTMDNIEEYLNNPVPTTHTPCLSSNIAFNNSSISG